jgi:plastocyanin
VSGLASIPADMHRRALLILATVGLIATGCSSITTPAVDYGAGGFFPFVVDSQDDMGQGNAVALTADGLPFVSYFGFAAKVAFGAPPPIPRPFGSPNVPGVMLSTSSSDGLWQRGAVEMQAASAALTPVGVSVPFGPVATDNLDLNAKNTNGTAVTVDSEGAASVAWTSANTVSYGTSALGSTATVDTVFTLGSKVSEAGPIGRPGITLDASGNPWIAFTVETSKGDEVHVANLVGSKWTDQVVASFPSCNECPSPQPTGIGVVGGAVMVVYADLSGKQVVALTQNGTTWTPTTVASGVSGYGLSFAAAAGGDSAIAAYYTGNGQVDAATFAQSAWTTDKAGSAPDPDESVNGSDGSSTAAAVSGDGTRYVAWTDEGIHMVSGTDSFSAVDLGPMVSTGIDPSLAATDQGAVALGWYDTLAGNQLLGYLGNVTDIVVARPSPSLTVSQAPPGGGGTCGSDKTVLLDQAAVGTTFTESCLVAAPGKFTVNFDNQAAGIQHNFEVLDKAGGKLIDGTDVATGPIKQTLPLDLTAGDYYFQCVVHPTTMFGTLAVVNGAK